MTHGSTSPLAQLTGQLVPWAERPDLSGNLFCLGVQSLVHCLLSSLLIVSLEPGVTPRVPWAHETQDAL